MTLAIDDRTLWHLKIVILDKLRRDESLTFTWRTFSGSGPGLDCVWLHPAIPMHFEFDDSSDIPLNWMWIESLVRAANSPSGLRLLPEDSGKPTPRENRLESTGVL